MRSRSFIAKTLVSTAALILVALLVLYSGAYNVAATEQHTRPVYWLLEAGLRSSVQQRAKDIVAPALEEPALVQLGLSCYRQHCVQCHGAPGISPDHFSKGLQPIPTNLAGVTREWTSGELYWITKYGIKMTGMPAWEFRLNERELWAVIAFLQQLPKLSALSYANVGERATSECGVNPQSASTRQHEGDATMGAKALRQYACTSCHEIPGVRGPKTRVGPTLAGIANRHFLAGRLPNTPANLVHWIRDPQQISPASAMPDLHVSEAHARHMAAYLGTLQ